MSTSALRKTLIRPPMNPSADTVLQETTAWLERVVIGLNLCPFAKAVYVKQQVRMVVSPAHHIDALLEDLDRELPLLAATDPQTLDTTLLIHPWVLGDFLAFNDFLALAEQAVEEHGLEGVLQVASFHPAYQFEGTAADDAGNYTNRAPYPTLHLLREDSIARAVAAYPDPSVIFDRNIATLQQLGITGYQQVLAGKEG